MKVGDKVLVNNHVIIIALKMLEKPVPAAMPDKSFIEGTIVEDEEDGNYIVDFGENKIGTTTIGKLSLAGWSIGEELDLEKAEQAIKQRINALKFAEAIQNALDTPTQQLPPPPSYERATQPQPPPPSYERATRKGGRRKKRRKKTKNKRGGVPTRTLQRQNAIIPQPTRRLYIQMPKSKTQKNRKKRVEMRRVKALANSKLYSNNKK
mgnify:CR=1 FL=1